MQTGQIGFRRLAQSLFDVVEYHWQCSVIWSDPVVEVN